ncbi:MAG: YigZ family protein [Eubacteriales bacterium]|nr:YigZ family protein [Clostridiales bacterium]MDY2768409.1 YigZ family protein [Eubacteriales bacterium]
MTLKPYKTLLTRASDEFIINKSRFIGYGAPAASEEEALGFLADVRSAHKDASHHCYAYIIGANMGVMRYSDDGEPGGTAGMPIIEVMKARQVTNACVVVVRYFGGVLLGAGGLTRAYSQGAATAINAAGVGEVSPTRRYLMEVPYPMLGRVEYLLKSLPVIVEDKQFSDAIVMTLIVRARDDEAFLSAVTSGTDGRIEPIFMEEMYKAWTE